jgi:NAD(P)-dependent dehydrogenase (short-subunit alcohol dehydrogenase family)
VQSASNFRMISRNAAPSQLHCCNATLWFTCSYDRSFANSAQIMMLLNNAGLLISSGLKDVTEQEMLDCYCVNAMGPIFTVQALLRRGLLKPGALVANVTGAPWEIASSSSKRFKHTEQLLHSQQQCAVAWVCAESITSRAQVLSVKPACLMRARVTLSSGVAQNDAVHTAPCRLRA